MLVILGQPQPR